MGLKLILGNDDDFIPPTLRGLEMFTILLFSMI